MQEEKIDILVSFDENYIMPFKVMLKSLVASNPHDSFRIWLLHSEISEEKLLVLTEYCSRHCMTLVAIKVAPSLFEHAPTSKQYPKEMYFRLLAPILLPDTLNRILYIDPDILVINPVRPLWETELGENVFAAASHGNIFGIINDVNRARLGKDHDYFNTGILLMDLKKARALVDVQAIFSCVSENMNTLILPDQDVFNILYGGNTLSLDDAIWNYDTRHYAAYLYENKEEYSMDQIMQNTVFLHFCGKQKPWKSKAGTRFSALYQHYMNIVSLE